MFLIKEVVMTDKALILVDFQNDYFPSFPEAKFPLHEPEKAVKNAALILKQFRDEGLPVIHVQHVSKSDASPFFHPNSEGVEIHTSVTPLATEKLIIKQAPNSFLGTDLLETLKALEVSDLVIMGAMSNMCIDAITRAAADMGYKCTVAHDATAACDLQFQDIKIPAKQVHGAFMAALSMAYANVTSTEEILKDI